MKVKAKIKTSHCPFCCGEVNITHGMTGATFWFFKCKKCGATISFNNDDTDEHAALRLTTAWNTRTPKERSGEK